MIEAQPQEVQELSIWGVLLIIVLCGLAGELYRADKGQYQAKHLAMRIVIRAFVSTMIGILAVIYGLHRHMEIYEIGAMAGGLAMLGADTVITVGTVLFKRRVNVQ